jgi:MFS family permease
MSPSAVTATRPRNVTLRIAPFVLIVFCTFLTIGMPLGALPSRVHHTLAFDNVTVGIVIGIQSLVTLVTRQFAGTLCDRSGAKFAVLVGGGVSIAGGAIYLLSTLPLLGAYASLGVLLLGRIFYGVAESLLMTGSLAWAIGFVGVQNTGRVMVWIGIGMYAAIAAGSPLGVQLMTGQHALDGFAAVSIGTMIFSALAIVLAAFTPRVAPITDERLPFIRVARRVLPFGAGLALATVGFGALAAFGVLDFQQKGWNGAGFALTAFGAAYICARLVFGGWPDRYGGLRVAVWSLLVESAGQILLWLAPAPGVAILGAVLTGLGFSLVFPAFGIEAVKRVPPGSRGAALGAYVAFFDLGFAVSGPANGLVAGAFGYPSVFAMGVAGTVAALLMAWRARRQND